MVGQELTLIFFIRPFIFWLGLVRSGREKGFQDAQTFRPSRPTTCRSALSHQFRIDAPLPFLSFPSLLNPCRGPAPGIKSFRRLIFKLTLSCVRNKKGTKQMNERWDFTEMMHVSNQQRTCPNTQKLHRHSPPLPRSFV